MDHDQPITTWKGKVIYGRKKHRFRMRDAKRIIADLELYDDKGAVWDAFEILRILNLKLRDMHKVPENVQETPLQELVAELRILFDELWDSLEGVSEELAEDKGLLEMMLGPIFGDPLLKP